MRQSELDIMKMKLLWNWHDLTGAKLPDLCHVAICEAQHTRLSITGHSCPPQQHQCESMAGMTTTPTLTLVSHIPHI